LLLFFKKEGLPSYVGVFGTAFAILCLSRKSERLNKAPKASGPVLTALRGKALHTPRRGQVELLHDCLILVNNDGCITNIHPDGAAAQACLGAIQSVRTLGPTQLLLPGLVDLHVHAPQFPQIGSALDIPLQNWLQTHTFPLESRYADLDYAAENYETLVDCLLANGTTTAMYFATIHLEATQCLADICLRRGQRALIGRVAMDNPAQCPPFYRDNSAALAEAETRAFIDYVRTLPGNASGLIRPVITPRFIPACTDDLLQRLGRLTQETGCHVQTHCSESDWEHDHVLARCGVTDTAALASFGLLSRRTILAHGNFLTDPDAALIHGAKAGIAHCPLSNAYFSDAVFPLRKMLDRGIHLGLGTDIAGGASPSLLENARHAVIASRHLENGVNPALARQERRSPGARITAEEAFWLATAGGGIALDLPVGQFASGYQFDAMVLDHALSGSNLAVSPGDDAGEILQKIVYNGCRRNVTEVWVGGRLVREG
jgi:guanine deaminase